MGGHSLLLGYFFFLFSQLIIFRFRFLVLFCSVILGLFWLFVSCFVVQVALLFFI